MLTTRLRELEKKYIVEREVLPTSPPSVEYSLTELGRELLPAIEGIAQVGHKLHLKEVAEMKKAEKSRAVTSNSTFETADGFVSN